MITATSDRGTKQVHDGETYVEFTRKFRAPIEDVWAAVTDPDRMARWVGTWNGDPATGEVQFRMLFEGDEASDEKVTIHRCEAPRLLHVTTTMAAGDGTQEWRLRLELSEVGQVTTLRFAQNVHDGAPVHEVGPGWQYYLDRLVLAETGADPSGINWEDYAALSEHYRAEFS